MQFVYLVTLLFGITQAKTDRFVRISLERIQPFQWLEQNSLDLNSQCLNPSADQSEKLSFDADIKNYCQKKQQISLVTQDCIYKNLNYVVKLDYLHDQTANKTVYKSYSQHIDLQTPWSWLKKPECFQYTKDGEQLIEQDCSPSEDYDKTFECKKNSCIIAKRCGQIFQQNEGLSLIGEFVLTKFKWDRSKNPIQQFKMLWVSGTSGQSFLKADGVLGLGRQFMPNVQNRKVEIKENMKVSLVEDGTNVLSLIKDQTKEFNILPLFSLYLDEDQEGSNICFGCIQKTFMYKPDQFEVKWAQIPPFDSETYPYDYFLWKVQPLSIIVMNKKQEYKSFNLTNLKRTIISISTTAMVLPKDELDQIVSVLNSFQQIDCTYQPKFLNFVICKSKENKQGLSILSGLQIVINLQSNDTSQVRLYINPEHLVQNCKVQDEIFQCMLNIQLAYNDIAVLGESVIKNSYMIFDQENGQIGFAPSLSKFNRESLIEEFLEKIEEIASEVVNFAKEDIQFLMMFVGILFFLIVSLVAFIFWAKILKKIKKIVKQITFRIRYRKSIAITDQVDLDLSNVENHNQTDDSDVRKQVQELQEHETLDGI